MSCIVIVQLLVLAIFNFWPKPDNERVFQDIEFSEDNVVIEDIQITRQESSPPPPTPRVPVPVPNDEVIEEEIVFEEVDFSEFSDSLSINETGEAGDGDEIVSSPQQPPSIVKIVEANATDEAKNAGLRARVWVTFLVDKQGKVEEATINSVEIYDKEEGKYKRAQTIGYGLTSKILSAALQWKFRPAKNNGKLVRAYTKHAFYFGI
ncbi:MAG: hypothetical protein U5J95_04680 [Balneolaceae bacterium]|nr:hypothetical protein [Balneolaceae bacterium]